MTQIHVEPQPRTRKDAEEVKETKPKRVRNEKLSDDIDAILDEVDAVLEDNASEFVRHYVQKGGE